MSGDLEIFSLQEEDVRMMLAATTQLGTSNLSFQMERYVFRRRADGVYVINLLNVWEKILLAARVIVTFENHADVFALSSRPFGQRPVFKYAAHTGATPIAGRFTPGMFTNRMQAKFREPGLLIVADPTYDHQPISEASLINIPVIAMCTTDSPLQFVDIAIPCNNKSPNSIGLVWWLLGREVLRLRGVLQRGDPWSVAVDLFLYRDPEDVEKDEMAVKESPVVQVGDKISTIDVTGMTPGDFIRSHYLNDGSQYAAVNNAKAQETGIAADADWGAPDSNEWMDGGQTREASVPATSPQAMYPFGNDWAAEVQAMDDSAIAAPVASSVVVHPPAPVDPRQSEWEMLTAEWED